MKQYNEDFKTKLYEHIKQIEDSSNVEIVAIIRAQSEKYLDVAMFFSAIASFVTFTIMMFIKAEINPYFIYLSVIISYVAIYLLFMLIPCFFRFFIKKKRMSRSVEIMSRALFQKGGIRQTKAKTGILIFVSLFEKTVRLEFDSGVLAALPSDVFEQMQADFQEIFKEKNSAVAFLKTLASCKEKFTAYIPPVENDINELPDNLQIEL